jgi:amino-acid N-acetyltransferase
MDTAPSKRELQHFLRRFDTTKTAKPTLLAGFEEIKGAPGVRSPKDYVNALLAPSFNQLALTKVEGSFGKNSWQAIGNTLYKLQKLGLTSIVVTDNSKWKLDKTQPAELINRMIRESQTLVEWIERAGGRARLIYGGNVMERLSSNSDIDVNLDFIQSALNNNQIPIVVPISTDKSGMQHPVRSNEAMIALTQRLSTQMMDPKLIPSKIVVINNEGGIPNHERPGTAHSLINIQEEYKDIEAAFEKNLKWHHTYPSTLSDLAMIRSSLQLLPITSSAIIAPTSSLPSALITNLVTDKPLYSSSLPTRDSSQINQAKTTVLRNGIKIENHYSLKELNKTRLTELLEASFQKKVDTDKYYKRLEHVLASAIVAGDYEGAVIMTNERANPQALPHAYLDKFAIAPSSQGIGLTDILWKRMCDAYPELLWRSRKDNGVNKWYSVFSFKKDSINLKLIHNICRYFERSNGYLRLKDSNWVLFWHGPNGYSFVQDYSTISNSIPASFMPVQ